MKAIYVADGMTDVRMIEGLADRFELEVLAPRSMEGKVTNWWPPKRPSLHDFHFLEGGRKAFIGKATRWLLRNKSRFEVAFALDSLTAALAANIARKFGGPPVILQVGRPTEEYFRSKAKTGIVTPGYRIGLGAVQALVGINERWADGIGAVSEYVAAASARRCKRVVAIPFYGVDTDVFAPRWSRQEARRTLGLREDLPVVLYRSRIAPEKDPETFLLAIRALRREREITAVYMGGEFPVFAELAEKFNVEVECRNAQSRDELPVWYVAADVTLQTSYAEGLGISLLESLACEVPIVVSDVGGLVEVADHGRTGILVPPGDANAAAEAVAGLLDEPDRAAELARRGREYVVERYSAKSAFDAWESLAREVASARKDSAKERREV